MDTSDTPAEGVSDKKRLLVFLLALLFGPFGVHRFYVGKTGTAVAMLVISLTLIGIVVTGVWATVDWIIILFGEFTDNGGRKISEWT